MPAPRRSQVAARRSQLVALLRLVLLGIVLPVRLSGQRTGESDSTPPVHGIGASAALGFRAGAAELQRAGGSQLVGVDLDLGRLTSVRTRFHIEATFIRGGLHEFVELEDKTYDGPIYDLTGSLAAVQLLRPVTRRVQPYVTVALSVHAMSSSLGSEILDRRYNTNNFGAQAGIGLRVRLGSRGHRALALELRRTSVQDMNRLSLTIGILRLMRELAVPLGG